MMRSAGKRSRRSGEILQLLRVRMPSTRPAAIVSAKASAGERQWNSRSTMDWSGSPKSPILTNVFTRISPKKCHMDGVPLGSPRRLSIVAAYRAVLKCGFLMPLSMNVMDAVAQGDAGVGARGREGVAQEVWHHALQGGVQSTLILACLISACRRVCSLPMTFNMLAAAVSAGVSTPIVRYRRFTSAVLTTA